MPLPNSKMKIMAKNGQGTVTFEDHTDRVQWTIAQLIRAANRDVGRYMVRLIRQKVRAINKYTNSAKYVPMRYQSWARKKENDLQIGVENTKYGAESAWWADQAELGTNGQPKRGFIRETVEENISTIRDIQGEYLSAIADEQAAIRLAKEAEQIKDEPDAQEED